MAREIVTRTKTRTTDELLAVLAVLGPPLRVLARGQGPGARWWALGAADFPEARLSAGEGAGLGLSVRSDRAPVAGDELRVLWPGRPARRPCLDCRVTGASEAETGWIALSLRVTCGPEPGHVSFRRADDTEKDAQAIR